MNKKTNTLLFVLGATVFNILATLLIFFGLLTIAVIINSSNELTPEVSDWFFMVCFIGSIVLTFLLYRFILKQLMKKIDFEKYFDPIFGKRKK